MSLFVGIDFGTSGCRAVAIDAEAKIQASADVALLPPTGRKGRSSQDAEGWWRALIDALAALAHQIPAASVHALSVDGTSGTLLLSDASGRPLGEALMYNDARSLAEAHRVASIAPPNCAAFGPTSALAKLLHLQSLPSTRQARHALHQADWIAGRLAGRYGMTDENNALKLGYDPVMRRWPDWLRDLGVRTDWLPDVLPSGSVIGELRHPEALALGYPVNATVIAGTTDSVAAFLATGARQAGDAVTSLGSTLVIKLMSGHPLFVADYGIYSHRLGDRWLVGGGSNTGGAVLLSYFTPRQIETMTPRLLPEHPTGLDYYPLVCPGERFPILDPVLPPRLSPRPPDDVTFFQGMLEGMGAIEALGYRRLQELGAPPPRRVFTVGGGARNEAWTRIRARQLGVPLEQPLHDQACYGAALIARAGIQNQQ